MNLQTIIKMADFNTMSRKWQKKWEDAKIFEVKEDPNKKKCYILEMFPYPMYFLASSKTVGSIVVCI